MKTVFKFLWKGQNKVVRMAMINTHENRALKVLDFKTNG